VVETIRRVLVETQAFPSSPGWMQQSAPTKRFSSHAGSSRICRHWCNHRGSRLCCGSALRGTSGRQPPILCVIARCTFDCRSSLGTRGSGRW
jgi:hypothetical protein